MIETGIERNLKQFLLVLSGSLSVSTLPQVLSWFRKIPYPLLLVIVRLGLALVDVQLVNLYPRIDLVNFLPPLLFEATWNLKWAELRRNLLPICCYAILGVVVSIAGTTIRLNQFTTISLTTALLIEVCQQPSQYQSWHDFENWVQANS